MIKIVLLFILGLVLICLGGDKLVDAAVVIAEKLGIPQIVVGATIVSLGTTLPEILVSTTAIFNGSAAISAGNAFGSIICNTALIAGLTQTIAPAKSVNTGSVTWRAAFFFAVIAVVEAIAFATHMAGHLTGIGLLAAFAVYAYLNVKRSSSEKEEEEEGEKAEEGGMPRQIITLAVCAVLLYFGAKLLVDNGILIAEAAGVPERVIAVTFIALGTSLPELVTSMVSIIKGFGSVGLGNIIGANILNLLLVIGIPAAFSTIPLESGTIMTDIPLAALVMAVLILPMLIRKKSSRVQGVLLLCIYAGYCICSFL